MANTYFWWNPSTGGDFSNSANWEEDVPPPGNGPPAGPPGAGDTADILVLVGNTISGSGSVASLTVGGIAVSVGGPDAITITGQLEATDFLSVGDATIDGGSVTSDTFNALFGTLDLVDGGMVVGPSADATAGQHLTIMNPVTVTDGTVQAGDLQLFSDISLEAGAITGTEVQFGGSGTSSQLTGGTVSAENGMVAVTPSDNTSVTLSGAGAVWNNDTTMVVGDVGTGNVEVTGGATLTAGGSGPTGREGLLIGSGSPVGLGQGTLDISAGTVGVTGDLVLGFGILSGGGSGVLNVEAGGTAGVSGTVDIGDITGGTGTVTVGGANAVLSADSLIVGNAGTGSLAINADGSASTSSDVTVGGSGGSGSMAVGASAELSIGGSLSVGAAGAGSFDVNTGSLSLTGWLVAGDARGGNGDVSFETTSFSNSSDIVIGNAGTGSLSVNANASINANDLDIGQALTGNGTVVFSGGSGFFSNVNVGQSGVASLEVSSKGTVSATNVIIGVNGVPVAASVSVDSSSVLQAGLQVTVGQLGNATLDVENGGKVQATSVVVGAGASVDATTTLNSSTTNKVTLIYGSLFEIGALGTADVTITGSAGATPDALDPGLVQIGLSSGASGTLSISGANAKLTAGTVEIGGGATVGGTGIVTLDSSGVLSSGTTTIWSGGSLVLTGGTLSGTTESFMGAASGFGSITGTITNASTITATGGVLSLGSLVSGTGTLALAAGTLDLKKGAAATEVIAFGTGADKLQLDAFAATKGTIEGFGTADTIVLTGTLADHGTWAGGVLTLTETAGAVGTLSIAGAFSADSFAVTNDGSNTTIEIACFATGTGIATTAGRKPVETLAVGDHVPTSSGRLARITWIGHRTLDFARHARPWDVMPVRVRAGALGEGVPLRDLVLSPDHAVLLDGALIPVRHLVNGASIVQETRQRITYWHVELDRHDALLAEGAPCESYLDTGNRAAFAGAATTQLHPDFARHRAMAIWSAGGCAPIVTDPADPVLRATHLALLARASSVPQNSVFQSDLSR
jgi:T5SS/PEP-CTERM-associated repeat protein